MPESLPCFLLNVRKWLCSDTVRKLHRMGGRGVNAYLFLLCEAWLQTPTGSLPNDEDLLIEFARVSQKEWDQIWPVMKHKFISDGNGRLFNDELVNEANNHGMKVFAGKKGWTKQRRKDQSDRVKARAESKAPASER